MVATDRAAVLSLRYRRVSFLVGGWGRLARCMLPLRPADTLTLVHQDDRLLVADKPAGLLCVPGRGPAGADNLAARVQVRCPDALVVHRLDMATSGLVLFGRGAATQRALSIAFAERQMDKRYEAVVAGLLADEAGEVDLPLGPDWPNRPRQQVDRAAGKPSVTRWQVLARDAAAGSTRLALQPLTGRTHQLRLHLAAIGHPILGDALYATPAALAAAPRLLLHACRLAWQDTHGDHAFHSPAPF
ncbi:RNA pseudouridine synthase [Rubrivivax pictus]|uniref:Dual-specificity RNA pseudouridine synthase RluA n=2 Tax=Pseudaquabacterium pictum TaxID=2315236 RepID=A0A480APM6_9BURK|nr:RNA pseudouridine synthase [Rubrivivax pictus]